jgi:hypothetical protein
MICWEISVNVFNISLDDACPKSSCSPFPEVMVWCDKLIQRWPDIKIDFFTSAAYARLNEDPYFLTKYPDWVKQMNALPTKNFRINCHSYYHRRLSAKHGNSNNNEVEKTNEKETRVLVQHMIGEFEAAGLKYEKVFRPPGWHLGVPAAKVLTEMGFKIAGNQHYYDILKSKVPEMKYVVSNWDMLNECKMDGNVLSYGHTSNWTTNFFNKKVYDRVARLLESQEFGFKWLGEM